MSLRRILFPPEPRQFPGQRWANIVLRSIHLVGIAGIGGGFLQGSPESAWLGFWHIVLASGVGLSLLYLAASAVWLLQLRGLVIAGKIGLLAVAIHWPAAREAAFISIIVVSGLIAHAPGKVRGWRPGA